MSEKISALPAATDVTNADFPIVQGGVNKKAAANLIAAPIYPANEIPFGDGTTAGGVTDAGVSVNIADGLIAFGSVALSGNIGINVIGIGQSTAGNNTGSDIVAIGRGAATDNTGSEVVGIGVGAATQNTGSNVIALGLSAGVANPLSGMFIIANTELPSYVDWAAADAAISATGSPNNTYLYYDQTNKNIGAVRL